MKRTILIISLLLMLVPALAWGGMVSYYGSYVQGFAPDPDKCLGTKTAGTVYKKGSGGNVDITGWTAIEFEPTNDGQVVFNGDATKIRNLTGGTKNLILLQPGVNQIVPSVDAVVCGM